MSFLAHTPFAAHALPLSEVPDPVFAGGVIEGGRTLLPEANYTCVTVHSPVDGAVTELESHAAAIISTREPSILIHLGTDTIDLRGRGFAPLIEKGDIVDAGAPLIHWGLGPVHTAGLSPCVPIIVVNPPGESISPKLDETLPTARILDLLFSLSDGD